MAQHRPRRCAVGATSHRHRGPRHRRCCNAYRPHRLGPRARGRCRRQPPCGAHVHQRHRRLATRRHVEPRQHGVEHQASHWHRRLNPCHRHRLRGAPDVPHHGPQRRARHLAGRGRYRCARAAFRSHHCARDNPRPQGHRCAWRTTNVGRLLDGRCARRRICNGAHRAHRRSQDARRRHASPRRALRRETGRGLRPHRGVTHRHLIGRRRPPTRLSGQGHRWCADAHRRRVW